MGLPRWGQINTSAPASSEWGKVCAKKDAAVSCCIKCQAKKGNLGLSYQKNNNRKAGTNFMMTLFLFNNCLRLNGDLFFCPF